MAHIIDLTGKKFNAFTVLGKSHKDEKGRWHWNCRCECGVLKVVFGFTLRGLRTKSCGCMMPALVSASRTKHGGYGTPEYRSWKAMKERCQPSHIHYERYGGRGISISPEWRDDFSTFLRDMGKRPPKHSLDRIDNDGNYEPGNCRWATAREQALNRAKRRPHKRGPRKPRLEGI